MLRILCIASKSRTYWLILTISIIGLINISLLIQYFLTLYPCILCIYQRCALFGIAIAGIIAIISPNTLLIRLSSIILWMYSAIKGLILSNTHINTILHPSPFLTCDLFIKFPDWLPLDQWWPIMFNAYGGNCAIYTWYFLSLELSQWMFIIFIIYLSIAILTLLSQSFSLYE